MKFSIWVDPWANIAAYSAEPTATDPRFRHAFASAWDREDERREPVAYSIEPMDSPINPSFHNGDSCVEVAIHEVLDERDDAMANAIHALITAFDAHLEPGLRDTSRYLASFRATVDAMLKFYDDPDGFNPCVIPPLPDITLLVGATTASRYDFWEAFT